MLLLTFILIILISLVFDRQERRHHFEKLLEYERLSIPTPKPKPKLLLLESWLNIILGLFLFSLGILFVYSIFSRLSEPQLSYSVRPAEFQLFAVFLAAGIALMMLGWKSVKLNRAYRKEMKKSD